MSVGVVSVSESERVRVRVRVDVVSARRPRSRCRESILESIHGRAMRMSVVVMSHEYDYE